MVLMIMVAFNFAQKTKIEAIRLFKEWCMQDNELLEPIQITSIQMVYNEDDAMEYGSRYGMPKQNIA